MEEEAVMSEECCPLFEPDAWQGKTQHWEGKRFVKEKVFCLFHMPIGFGAAMTRIMAKLDAAKATCVDGLCLSEHTSRWNMDVLVAVDQEVPGATSAELSGTFYTRVYEGPFRDSGKWHQDFADQARQASLDIQNEYAWYTTCPKCAAKRGKNYVVLFGKVRTASAA
jgi:hypothetical protein